MLLGLQLSASLARQPVEARPAIMFRGDRAFLFELQQNRIQSALIHGEQVPADLLDATEIP